MTTPPRRASIQDEICGAVICFAAVQLSALTAVFVIRFEGSGIWL